MESWESDAWWKEAASCMCLGARNLRANRRNKPHNDPKVSAVSYYRLELLLSSSPFCSSTRKTTWGSRLRKSWQLVYLQLAQDMLHVHVESMTHYMQLYEIRYLCIFHTLSVHCLHSSIPSGFSRFAACTTALLSMDPSPQASVGSEAPGLLCPMMFDNKTMVEIWFSFRF